MGNVLREENLCFNFDENTFLRKPEKFDVKNPTGMMGVDFIAETEENQYFIEVKDFQNPNSTDERRRVDLEMLKAAIKDKTNLPEQGDGAFVAKGAVFTLKIAQKIKDSLLRKYALGGNFNKNVIYLVVINLDSFGTHEFKRLKEKISGHIPTGLNGAEFTYFSNISFDLVNIDQLESYGIICSKIHK